MGLGLRGAWSSIELRLSFSKCQRTLCDMRQEAELQPYVDRLLAIPFVRKVRAVPPSATAKRPFDYELELQTPTGKQRISFELKKSHLSRVMAEQIVTSQKSNRNPFLILAPSVGSVLGELLEREHVMFLDLAGNCHLDLDGKYIARVQGRKAVARPSADKGMRAPAYRVLFALLAEPARVTNSVRALAEAAGVSRQAALDIRHRLARLGVLIQTRSGFRWVAGRHKEAIDMFVTGYLTTLRPELVLGRFRTRDSEPPALEARFVSEMGRNDLRWGGAAAAHRMTGHYRGGHTVIHVMELPGNMRKLQAIPDRAGPLELVMPPGLLGMRGVTEDTAHPLLVYAELLAEGNERAREAAQEVAARWLPAELFA
jgi:hypothetical protein